MGFKRSLFQIEVTFSRFNHLFILVIIFFFISCEREIVIEPLSDSVPPAVPQNLNVYYEADGEVGIEWQKNYEPDIRGYKIFRAADDSTLLTEIGFTADIYYIDDSLEYDQTYFYSISAFDLSGLASELCPSVKARPVNRFVPYPPSGLRINARNINELLSVYLEWQPPYDRDLAGYEIYRSNIPGFQIDSSLLCGFVTENDFTDQKDLVPLVNYYYKIVSVDRGLLRSRNNPEIQDIIFDQPDLIYPADGLSLDYFFEFRIETVSSSANYKIVIQSNDIYGPVEELNFHSELNDEVISIYFNSYILKPYTKYYWRLIAYSPFSSEPNTWTDFYDFNIIPK